MPLLTKKQAAERLSIGLRTLEGLIARGAIPAYKVGPKLVRLREEDLERYLAGQLVAPEAARERPEPARPCRYVPGMKVV